MHVKPYTFDSLPANAWPSPAKLNLFLHITGQREDGYHNLQTLFQLLDASDALYFDIKRNSLNLDTDAPIPGQDNLIIRAAKALQAHTGCQKGAKITLHKRLPIGGGVAGGSSNAATTLIALNRLWGLELSQATLEKIGLSLGADVPLFVGAQTAFAEGLGEQLTPITVPKLWYLVLTPKCHVSTPAIFGHKDLTRDTEISRIRRYEIGMGHNDCEPLVRRLYPPVDDAIKWLSQHADARLTGTGSSVFSAFTNRSDAEEIFAQRPTGLEGFIAQGVNASPLAQKD